jgi:oligosaccharide repeat unit polymerase
MECLPPNPNNIQRSLVRNSAIALQALVCLLIVVAGTILSVTGGVATIYGISSALTATLVWSLWSWWLMTGTLFDPYIMFMMSLFLFNAGQTLLEIVGLNAHGMLGGIFDDEVLVGTLYMVLLGINFTHLGGLLAVRRRRTSCFATWSIADGHALRTVGWILLVCSVIPSSLLLWKTTTTVMAGGYMAAYQREAPTGVAAGPQLIAMFIVPAALLLLAGANGRMREKMSATIVMGLHTLIQLFLGYRSTAIMPACAFLWLWHGCEGKIKTRWLLGAGLLLVMVIVPLSRETRTFTGAERVDLQAFANTYVTIENPIVSTISEMGGSMITVAYTYVLVPSTRVFDDGAGYAYAALTLLPNLFWSVHPTIARGTASDWLIQTVDPFGAMRQGGLGYSCIAEAYLNFGWAGVPIIMCLIGFGVATLTAFGTEGDRRGLAMAAIFTAFVLRFPRDEAASLVRAFVWYSWLPYVVTAWMARSSMRKPLSSVPSSIG